MTSGVGPIPARIAIVGEAFGENEEKAGEPFVGASGIELNRMLKEVGIERSECFVTNLVNARPPKNDLAHWIAMKKGDVTAKHIPFRGKMVLPIIAQGHAQMLAELDAVKPNIIVAVGGWALWALTGKEGIKRWRGSQLCTENAVKCIPTYHPAYILRDWASRAIAVNDLKRAARERSTKEYTNIPTWAFTIRPTFTQAQSVLLDLINRVENGPPLWIEFDFETKAGHISCIGLSWSPLEALCIPFISRSCVDGYWNVDEEATLVHLLYRLLCHPRCLVRGQNLLYDCQYSYRHWHFIPNVKQDTMISHHTCWCGMQKSLDFQASMYSDYYVQWKPEKTAWKEGG